MSQRIPRLEEEILSLPDFHDDGDLFDDERSSSVIPARRRRAFIILSIILLVLLLAGIVLVVKYRTHIVYQTKRITQGDLVLTVPASGSLHTTIYTVNFMGAGKLAAVDVTIGEQVKKDQILARLDPTSLQNALNEAQANLGAAQTVLDNANANYGAIQSAIQSANQSGIASAQIQPSASPSITRVSPAEGSTVNSPSLSTPQPRIVPAQQFFATGGVNKVQETEALGQIKAAQKALALAQIKLATAQYNLNDAVLKAPHAGTIATLNGAVGGAPEATFIQIIDSSSLQLQVNVNEDTIGTVTIGDAVSFSVDAYPGQSFEGNVVTILPLGQSNSSTVTYPVLIPLVSAVPSGVHLFPGMTARATITTNQRTGVVVVPASALAFAQAQAKSGNQSLVQRAQIQKALTRANEMLQNLQQDVLQDNPAPAVVLERNAYAKITVIPIVVGLTNGAEYEVLDGLSANAVVLIGARTSSN